MLINSDSGAYRLSSSIVNDNEDAEQQQQQQSTTGLSNHSNNHGLDDTQQQQDKLVGPALSQLDLFIENIQAGATTGDYSCLASNTEGSVEAHSQVVLAVPAIITTMPRNQTKLEGEKVEFLCQAKALPSNITYKWLFNDKPIQLIKTFEFRHLIKRDGTLVVNSIRRDDQGEYKCQATNGLAHRNRQLVSSAIISSSKTSLTTSAITTTQSDATTKTAAQQQQQNSKTKNSNYKLSAQNSQSKEEQQQQQQLLQLPAPIYAEASAHLIVEFPARISYSPPVQYLPLGLSGMIRCFVQANPQVEFFTWTLNNQQFDPNIDQNVERLLNGSILIKSVTKQYEGIYRCTPFNKHGSAGSSSAMEVRVEEPPYFELKPAESYKADVNSQIKIPCDGKGSPKASVSWRKVLLKSNHHHQLISEREHEHVKTSKNNKRRLASNMQTTTSISSLIVDEVADEPNEDHHLYATNTSISTPNNMLNHNLSYENHSTNHEDDVNNNNNNNHNDKEQSVIVYAKLPADRSEYRDSHLFLHGLRKEDHGRYECVLENEVATLVASTMLYIQGKLTKQASNEHNFGCSNLIQNTNNNNNIITLHH